MAKKYDGYTPMGPLAAGLGLAAASLAAANPVTSPAAATIGTMVAGFASGITLTDEEKNIKNEIGKDGLDAEIKKIVFVTKSKIQII